ncbi:MAG: hypothetical protein QM770_02885 [Tepidisphaeraceae bacterium]
MPSKQQHQFSQVVNGEATSTEDLSERIRATVEREPGDIVRCTRVTENQYRCNWWRSVFTEQFHNPGMKGGQLGTTYRVCRSAFFKAVTSDSGELTLTEAPQRPRRGRFG